MNLVLLPVLLLVLPVLAVSECRNGPILFNFGDSNSDTGGYMAGLGANISLPNGRLLPNRPSGGRLCDGRLVIDFLCQCSVQPLLRLYCFIYHVVIIDGSHHVFGLDKTIYRRWILEHKLLEPVLGVLRVRFQARRRLCHSRGNNTSVRYESLHVARPSPSVSPLQVAVSRAHCTRCLLESRLYLHC